MNNNMINSISTATNMYDTQYCAYRLPCGICTKLQRSCPMQQTWTLTTYGYAESESFRRQNDPKYTTTTATCRKDD